MGERPKPRPPTGSVGQSIGGALVGFDEQVFGRQPPGGEVHEQIDRTHTISASQGLTIELPPDTDEAEHGPSSDQRDRADR